jgi:RNA polymerase sigma-70 factor (ECF subfamily)
MDRTTEQTLIARAAAGDRSAMASLIQAHQASLQCYMLRMTGRADIAEDVTQEAFFRALRHLDRYDPRWRFSTWLFTIARRVWLNQRERRGPRFDSDLVARTDDLRPVWSLAGWTSEADEERARSRDRLERALRELSEEQREVVVLFHQMEWPIRVIATVMDMPEGTVKSHLHRARGRLRELMTQSGPKGDEDRERAPLVEHARRSPAQAEGAGSLQGSGESGGSGALGGSGAMGASGGSSGPTSVAAHFSQPPIPQKDARAATPAWGAREHRRRESR